MRCFGYGVMAYGIKYTHTLRGCPHACTTALSKTDRCRRPSLELRENIRCMRHGTHIMSYERNTEEFLFQFFCVAVWRGRAGHHSPVVLFAPAALCLAATCSVCEKHQACRTRWAWPFPAGGCRCLLHSFPSTSCKGGGHFRSIALAPHPFSLIPTPPLCLSPCVHFNCLFPAFLCTHAPKFSLSAAPFPSASYFFL